MLTPDGGRRVVGVVGDIHHGGPERAGTKEIGISMALGASETLVQRQIVGKTLRLALTGMVLGTLATFRADSVDRIPAVFYAADGPGGAFSNVSAYLRGGIGSRLRSRTTGVAH